jgi:hypothetical protein
MKIEIEKHPNGSVKSVSVAREGGVFSTLFWIGILVFIGLPLLASMAALFGVAFAGLWVIEKISGAWYTVTKPFRKLKFRPNTRIGRL